jgi:hypothetical protein
MPQKGKGSKKTSGIKPADKDSTVYKVKEILQRRALEGGKKEYLVWWENCSQEEATWEPCENFEGGEGNQAVKEFETKRQKQLSRVIREKQAQGREDLLQSVKENHEHQKVLLQQLSNKRQDGGKEVDGGSIPSESESSGDDNGDKSNGSNSGSESESEGNQKRPKKGAKRGGDVSAANSTTPGKGTLLNWVAKPSGDSQGSALKVSCLLGFRGSLCLKG